MMFQKKENPETQDFLGLGGPSRARTVDTLIKSQVLYQLS